jgi:hypothetical protein
VPIEVLQKPEEYRKTISGRKAEKKEADRDDDKGNPSVDFRGERRSNATHRSATDPDARIATKSGKETAVPAYTVNGVMGNRNRILVGIGVETFRGPLSERDGALNLLDRARKRLKLKPESLGADKGYFEGKFIGGLLDRKVEPHIAAQERGHGGEYMRVRMRQRSAFYKLSQRARKKIEELWGEAKEEHGFRRFCRRTLENVRQEALMMGWLLNFKRLNAIHAAAAG